MKNNIIENVNTIMQEENLARQTAAPSPKKSTPALIMIFALSALMTVFFIHLLKLNLLPPFHLLALAAGLLILLLLVAVLSWNRKRKLCMALGILLTLLITGGCVLGTVYANKAISTLQRVTTPQEISTKTIGLFVRKDDPATSLMDLKSVPLGRLTTVDREEMDSVLRQIGDVWGESPSALLYTTPFSLIHGITGGKVRAILMSHTLLEAMSYNMENFSSEELREICVFEETRTMTPEKEEIPLDKPFVLYISGIDSRTGLRDFSLSDVNILAAVNPSTRQVLLVNTPRDFFVNTTVSGPEKDKLTHAGQYGIECSMGTMAMLYEVDIDYYFRVDFDGFKAIIDALGGVDVYSDQTFSVESYTFQEGINHLTGYQALLFARHRYGLDGGDRARGVHQMAVIEAVLKKAASSELVKNFFPLMDAVAGGFETSVPYNTLTSLVQSQLAHGEKWKVKSFSVNGSDGISSTFSLDGDLYVMIPDEELVAAARQLIRDVLEGKEIDLP